jgi:sugar/nucleoside kinase (ribokinase family)
LAARLEVRADRWRYRALVGTGGIGSGVFFALEGNHTLGREESRSGRYLDRRDYCKLHIIAHYVQVLLGNAFSVFPIGRVGNDDSGRRLLEDMAQVGMDLRHVQVAPDSPTLYSLCFVYPDGAGGNLTVADSASDRVDPAQVRKAEPELCAFGAEAIALAAPEAPLAARAELLDLATRTGALRVGAFTTAEIEPALASDLLRRLDLLALNRDEAAALAALPSTSLPAEIAAAAVRAVQRSQPALWLSVTSGADGSWVWDGRNLQHRPAHPVPVVNTAGAGDAHLAGLLCGLAAGLPLAEAHALAALVAAVSVTSPHTIHDGLDAAALSAPAQGSLASLPASVRALLSLP